MHHATTTVCLATVALFAVLTAAAVCVGVNAPPTAEPWPLVVHIEKGETFENIAVAADGAARMIAGQRGSVRSARNLRVGDATREALAKSAAALASDAAVVGKRFAKTAALAESSVAPTPAPPIHDEFEIARGGANGLLCSGQAAAAPAAVREFLAAVHRDVAAAPVEGSDKPVPALRVRPLREALAADGKTPNEASDDAKVLADLRTQGVKVVELSAEKLAEAELLARAVATPRAVVLAADLAAVRQACGDEREPVIVTPSGAFRVQFLPPTQ